MKRDPKLRMMTSSEIRASFLEFFRKNGHTVVPSSSLVPGNDPTLLFTNAGMVQFKDVFLGKDSRSYSRAASAQRCVRAGGKHNDLENVGYTSRHHTFFEMLGNFSFGDYFKREAIHFAWNYITGTLGIPKERLWTTVYEEDDEAQRIWTEEIRIDPTRCARMGEKSNFWSMGETGPCGPCSEIFYDHGPDVPGGPPVRRTRMATATWMESRFHAIRSIGGRLTRGPPQALGRHGDGSRARCGGDAGRAQQLRYRPLQGLDSRGGGDHRHSRDRLPESAGDRRSHSGVHLSDHRWGGAFQRGPGYVLRRIIRRAIRHGYKLGQTQPFFYKLVPTLVREMGDYYTELVQGEKRAAEILAQEESRFAETLTTGMALLDAETAKLTSSVIPGETVFRLYDTYGFPVDLTADVARERGYTIDQQGFDAAMAAQRDRGRSASKFGVALKDSVKLSGKTDFSGYDRLQGAARVTALIFDGAVVNTLGVGQEGQVVLDETPFYAEGGGQMGDSGTLSSPGARFTVRDTQKIGASFAHIGVVDSGILRVGDALEARVDGERRTAIALNHSATHLLHAALRAVLGKHVQQKGSLVAPDRLRFDFSHTQAVAADNLHQIEEMVNRAIRRNDPAQTRVMALDDAVAAGAMSLFGEKYESDVRVLSSAISPWNSAAALTSKGPAISDCSRSSARPAWRRRSPHRGGDRPGRIRVGGSVGSSRARYRRRVAGQPRGRG